MDADIEPDGKLSDRVTFGLALRCERGGFNIGSGAPAGAYAERSSRRRSRLKRSLTRWGIWDISI